MSRPEPGRRAEYPRFEILDTRWRDNDVYGHMNNAVHYQLFDTAVNGYLLQAGVLDFQGGAGVFLVVSSACDYFSELAFPDKIHIGLLVDRLGASSVAYRIGLFRNEADQAAAEGRFVHVHVDRISRRPSPIPEATRAALAPLMV